MRTRDFAFDAPDTVPSGRTLVRLTNDGPDFHHVLLVRLAPGRTVADLLRHFRTGHEPIPAWAVDVGGPNTPGSPGEQTNAVLDLTPGEYAMVCVIPGRADGRPHVMSGMIRPLTVVGSATVPASAVPASRVDRTMTLDDYGFELDTPITAGRQVIRVVNHATQSHEVVVVKLAPGRTAGDFLRFLGRPEGEPPGRMIGGVTWLARGMANDVTLEFEPGEYALICFVPDASDGQPHFVHGMVEQIRVQ